MSPSLTYQRTSALGEAVVLGKERDHVAELLAHGRTVAEVLQGAELDDVQPLVLGGLGECRLDERQGALIVTGVDPLGDDDQVRGDLGRILGQHRPGHGHRRLLVAGGVVDGGLERADLGVLRRHGIGGIDMGTGGLEVAGVECEFGDLLAAFQAVGVLLDQPEVLSEGLAHLAPRSRRMPA